jgi:hypothetical protein
MLEIFAPYLLFISFFITVLFNLWLISKNANWIIIIIANLLLILVMEFLNFAEYNFLNQVVKWIIQTIGDFIVDLWNFIFGNNNPDVPFGGGGFKGSP